MISLCRHFGERDEKSGTVLFPDSVFHPEFRPGIRPSPVTLPHHVWDTNELRSFEVTTGLVVPSGMPSFLLRFNLFSI